MTIQASVDGKPLAESAIPYDNGVILQSLCHLHRYTRTPSDAHIYERPDRLRSIRLGLAAAHGRLLESCSQSRASASSVESKDSNTDAKAVQNYDSKDVSTAPLEELLDNLSLNTSSITASQSLSSLHTGSPFSIFTTSRRLALASPVEAAIALAHGEDYIPKLTSYLVNTVHRQGTGQSEVPDSLSQGDLYLCESSTEALEGALGACCDGVDQVCSQGVSHIRRFVSVRPPGHHCETEQPMGFCWLNNVAVAAAYAHLKYEINRVVILDIDLHHGNGTQQIAWRINALAYKHIQNLSKKSSPRKGSPRKAGAPLEEPTKQPLQVFYGSIHDVNSYPCEDLDPVLIAAASVNISGGGGGQYITNIHLEPYASTDEFKSVLYPRYRDGLFDAASSFLKKTSATPRNTLLLISAGFDASEHEYAAMSRHNAKVPTVFYESFARDAAVFADKYGQGRVLAVLEGGYSQKALMTGIGSFMRGWVQTDQTLTQCDWWSESEMQQCESMLAIPKQGKNGAGQGQTGKAAALIEEPWYQHSKRIFTQMQQASPDMHYVKPIAKAVNIAASASFKEMLASTARVTRSKASTPVASPQRALVDRASLPTAPAIDAHAAVLGPPPASSEGVSSRNKSRPLPESHSRQSDILQDQRTDQQPAPPADKPMSKIEDKDPLPVTKPKANPSIRFTFKAGEHSYQHYRDPRNGRDTQSAEPETETESKSEASA